MRRRQCAKLGARHKACAGVATLADAYFFSGLKDFGAMPNCAIL